MRTIIQIPGEPWTFVNKKTGQRVSGILPSKRGESNSFAEWLSNPRYSKGGRWGSRLFHNQAAVRYGNGTGPSGLLGSMRRRFITLKSVSNANDYRPPDTTPEKMVDIWNNQKGLCAACKGSLDLLKSYFDHNHETGEARGFLHRHCNMAEGSLTRMVNEEFENYMNFIRKIRYGKT
jgi:Recombination endonuclease VII